MSGLSVALRGPLPAEVDFGGVVTSVPHFFMGSNTHAMHEAFDVHADDGTDVEIVDNVDLAPRVPVTTGDRVAVQGELVSDPGREPVVHWTHHDPAGRHPDGFIDFAGRRYA